MEIYILCKERSTETAYRFIECFLGKTCSTSKSYPLPQYIQNPDFLFKNYHDLLEKLVEQKTETYSLYWRSIVVPHPIDTGMLFFTKDGAMIAGVAVGESKEEKWLEKLATVMGTLYGYINFDSPPPDTSKNFIDICKNAGPPKIFEGIFFK